ncbi:MAG: class I SAM-dependent methyltransferase [Pseudomonadota bacterium]
MFAATPMRTASTGERTMKEYFLNFLKNTDDRSVMKWTHYFDVYADELKPFYKKNISFLEIGIFKGGSIPMWKGCFASSSQLVFLDIDPDCKALAERGTIVEIGDQSDPKFLKRMANNYGPFDVIIDDGGHQMNQQIISFENLWPSLRPGGVYLVEDTHTSYWPGFGGGYRNEASFIEYAKRLVDSMHSWYTEDDDAFPFDPLANELGYVRFYDSIVAMKKISRKRPPTSVMSRNGKIQTSRRALEIRGRTSSFKAD